MTDTAQPFNLENTLNHFILPALPMLADRLGISIGQTKLFSQAVVAIFITKLQGDTGIFVFDEKNQLDSTHKKHTLAKYQKFNQTPFGYHSLSELPIISLHGFFSDNHNNDSLTKLIKNLSQSYHLSTKVVYDGLLILLSLCQYYLVHFIYELSLSKNAYHSFIISQQNTTHRLSDDVLAILKNTLGTTLKTNEHFALSENDVNQNSLPILAIGRTPTIITPKPATPTKKRGPLMVFGAIGAVFGAILIASCAYFLNKLNKQEAKPTPTVTTTQKPIIQDVAIIRTDGKDSTQAAQETTKNTAQETATPAVANQAPNNSTTKTDTPASQSPKPVAQKSTAQNSNSQKSTQSKSANTKKDNTTKKQNSTKQENKTKKDNKKDNTAKKASAQSKSDAKKKASEKPKATSKSTQGQKSDKKPINKDNKKTP